MMLCEFKPDLAACLRDRGVPSLTSLADVIAFNEREAERETRWFGQDLFVRVERTADLDATGYRRKQARICGLACEQGIDRRATCRRSRRLAGASASAWRGGLNFLSVFIRQRFATGFRSRHRPVHRVCRSARNRCR